MEWLDEVNGTGGGQAREENQRDMDYGHGATVVDFGIYKALTRTEMIPPIDKKVE